MLRVKDFLLQQLIRRKYREAVIGFSTVVLATGQFDTIIARTASDFATAQIDSGMEPPAYTQNSPYGIWSFEFE